MNLPQAPTARTEIAELMGFIDSGIEHCRAGRWSKGAEYLKYAAARVGGGLDEAGLFLSYLGCAMARTQERTAEGLALCERAVKLEFYQPENWANLADVLLLAGRRSEAIDAVRNGLRIDRQYSRLVALHDRLGMRRRPVIPFLARSNPLNHLLGLLASQARRVGGGAQIEPDAGRPSADGPRG